MNPPRIEPKCPDCGYRLIWDGVQFWICGACAEGFTEDEAREFEQA